MNFFKHLKTVLKHKYYVFIHCCKAGIVWQGIVHDISKFSPTEFIPSAKFYRGTGSPIDVERQKYGYSKAWMHHKGRNKHHYEYWTDYSPEIGGYVPVPMPTKYVIEMFCDMYAANKVYRGKAHTSKDSLAFFVSRNMEQKMHPKTARILKSLLTTLANEGEKSAFKQIRKLKKYGDII